jgi:DNA-binding LacI/PurR family transcriptional regulator
MTDRPTIDQVAARAGVGRGTVSRVVNGSPTVAPQTRAAVERAIEEMKYIPNRAARSLVTRRTEAIALVVPETVERVFSTPFFAGVIRGISDGLETSGQQLLMALAGPVDRRARLERYLSSGHVDGVLMLSLHRDDPLPATLARLGVPAVQGGRRLEIDGNYHVVDVDNQAGAHLAVGHLLARGRRRIAAITGPMDMVAAVHRLDGYHDALLAAGLPEVDSLIAHGDFGEASGEQAIGELLARHPDLDAVFAASDLMAIGAMHGLAVAGRRVPQDVAVVGFGDTATARTSGTQLTSVHQPVELMGQEMARMVGELIRGDTPAQPTLVLTPRLIVRDTT